MFFISPIKTLYSIKFYLQTLKEPLWKAFCFVVYLFVLGTIFLAIYIPVKLQQPLTEGVEKVANYVPNIKISKGVITANNDERLVINLKEFQDYKIIFDTASTEPAYPTQMQKENILMYVNKNTVYAYNHGNKRMEAFPMDEKFEGEFSKETILTKKNEIVKILSYLIVIAALLILMFRLIFLAIIALIVAFIINAATGANLGFKKLLILALYLLGPVLILDFVLFVLPFHIIGMSALIAIIIFVIYLNLIFLHLRAEINKKIEIEEGAE